MKNGFKLFLVICFIFTLVFSAAFASNSGVQITQCSNDHSLIPGQCCVYHSTGCNDGRGTIVMLEDQICVCQLVPTHTACYIAPECY